MNIILLVNIIISPAHTPSVKTGDNNGNRYYMFTSTRLPQLRISTFAESNIFKQCPKSRFADSAASLELSTMTPGSESRNVLCFPFRLINWWQPTLKLWEFPSWCLCGPCWAKFGLLPQGYFVFSQTCSEAILESSPLQ